MNIEDVVTTKDIAQMFACSFDHVSKHRRAIRTMKGYQPYSLITRQDLLDWKELHNRLKPSERKLYFKGLETKTETKTEAQP